MQTVDYIYCNSCGYEDFDVKVAYSRCTANGDWYLCPKCNKETSDVNIDLAEETTVSNPVEACDSGGLNKNSLQNIGIKSKLSKSDKGWLSRLSSMLYDEGWYTKSIYLQQMIDNSGDI